MDRAKFYFLVIVMGAFFGGFGVLGTFSAVALIVGLVQISRMKGQPAFFARRTTVDLVIASLLCLVSGIAFVAIFKAVWIS